MNGDYSIGGKFWERQTTVKKVGHPLLFATAEDLWSAAKEYFDDCLSNNIKIPDWVGKDADKVEREKPIPFSLSGFALFVGASKNWWSELRKNENLPKEYLGIIARIEDVIFTQQYAGAAANVFQHNIVARYLGLAEKNETAHSGSIIWNEEKTYEADEEANESA